MNKTALLVIVLVLVLGGIGYFFFAKGGYQPTNAPQTPSTMPTTTAQPSGNSVTIANMGFTPSTLQVKVGDTVTWTNNDPYNHTVTSDTGLFTSGNVAPGGTFSYKFTQAGTFSYHCSIHTSMTASVTVQ